MSAETEIVQVSTEIRDSVVTQAGFGTALIAGVYPMPDRVLGPFSSADELLEAPYGLSTTHPVYLKARALMSQESSPTGFKLGKRRNLPTQVVQLTPASPTEGDTYSLEVDGATISVSAGAAPTVAAIVAALQAALDRVDGVSATDNGTHVTCSADTAGEFHAFEAPSANLELEDLTTDPGIVEDLAAIKLADDRSKVAGFYGLLIDAWDKRSITAAAAWAESQTLLYLACTADTETLDGTVTDDVASALQTAGYHRSPLLFHNKPITQAADAAWMGRLFPKLPGQATWMGKSLAGVDTLRLTTAERASAKAKHLNIYVPVAGNGCTKEGWAPSGRYIDVTRTNDWFVARLVEGILSALLNNDKIGQNDKDTQVVRQVFDGVVAAGVSNRAIDSDTPASITIPAVASLSQNDRAARRLTGIKYRYRLQGAFHAFDIRGEVSV